MAHDPFLIWLLVETINQHGRRMAGLSSLSLLCSICTLMHWHSTQSSPLPVTNCCYSCPIDIACSCQHIRNGTSCSHRMAKSIAQLTLCQVTGEEIETATKLLEKACHKLRSTRDPLRDAEERQRTRERNLSCL